MKLDASRGLEPGRRAITMQRFAAGGPAGWEGGVEAIAMNPRYDIGPYEPYPCGSGKKYKFCCAVRGKDVRHGKFPIGTIAYYGPDDTTTTKIAAGVLTHEFAEPIVERWVDTNILNNTKVQDEIKRFFARHAVKSVVVSDGNMGCPHEEGDDFPEGTDCPFCPFWAGKQGRARRDEPLLPPAPTGDDFDAEEDEDLGEALDDADFDDDEQDEEEDDYDAALERIEAIIGDDVDDTEQAISVLAKHLQARLELPCEVTGIEDFRWEEPYVFGGWSPREYKRLKKTQPSYRDRFTLFAIEHGPSSEWMLFEEDIAAHVVRVSDGRKFILGLSELKATDQSSPNHQLLRDYAVWLANNR